MDLQGGRILLTYEFRRKNKEVCRTDIQRIEAVKNILSIPEILLEPLQGRAEDIENYALLYIHHCNEQLGTNVVGLEPEAMGLLEAYPWNYNLRELERILREAVQTARAPWLSAAAIRALLRQEQETAREKNAAGLNLHKTLAEIEYDIVREVLAEENMNQSAAAQRLGINRSTIWRILRRHERDLP